MSLEWIAIEKKMLKEGIFYHGHMQQGVVGLIQKELDKQKPDTSSANRRKKKRKERPINS